MNRRLPYYIVHVLTMILGIFLYTKPELSIIIISKIFGTALIIYAIARSVSMFLAKERESLFTLGLIVNIAIIVFGILMILNSFRISAIVGLMIGIYIIINALWKLRTAFVAKNIGLRHWYILLMISILSIIIGIVALSSFPDIVKISLQVLAIGLISDSVLNILSLIYKSKIEQAKA